MQKLLAMTLVGAAMSAATAVQAGPSASRLPLDWSYTYTSTDVGYFGASGGGSATRLNVAIGYRLNRHYAVEGGYEGTYIGGASAHGGYVDVFGFLPLGRGSRVSLFATGGAAYVSSVYIYGTGFYASAFGVRGGGGLEWRMSEKWALRGAVRYETTITNATVASVGFTVRF